MFRLFGTNIEAAADEAHFSLILPEVVHHAGFPVRPDRFAFKERPRRSKVASLWTSLIPDESTLALTLALALGRWGGRHVVDP